MITFQCNASASTGFGHLMRCRTLALELKKRGVSAVMVGPSLEWQTENDRELFADWVEGEWTSSRVTAARLADIACSHHSAVCVLDDYRVDETFQLVLRARDLRWMQQFNSAAPPPFFGDWVVNAGPRETEDLYLNLRRSDTTRFLLGPKYAVLRPSFRNLPTRNQVRLRTVMVSLGGGDDRGVIEPLVTALLAEGPEGVKYRIMSGRSNPSNARLAEWVQAMANDRVALVVDPSDVLAEYQQSDVAIIAGGTSTFEAAAVGLPMIIIAMADNQINQSLGWVERGAGYYVGIYSDFEVAAVVEHLRAFSEEGAIAPMAHAAQATVDGLGCSLLADVLVEAAR